jgi:hypothetical protein
VERNVRGWELSIVEHELTDEGTRLFGLDTMVNSIPAFYNTCIDMTLLLFSPPVPLCPLGGCDIRLHNTN